MFNILIVDDEINIQQLFKIRLVNAGYHVLTASDGEEALDIFYNQQIDMLIVDVMMPNMNGMELVNTIRNEGYNTPVIMVTAKGKLEDKKEGFLVGIDDYMVKPVEFDELLFRMNALFRRAKIVNERKITIGNTILDYDTLSILDKKKNLRITLTKKEFQILFKLLSYPERSFTKGQLFDEFWGLDNDSDDDVVKVYVSKIRDRIKDFDEIEIDTIRGIGYRGIRNEKK